MFIKKIYSALGTRDIRKVINSLINQWEFRKKATILHSFPACVDIEITNRCPLCCMHCPRSYRDVNKINMELGVLSFEKFAEIIAKLRPVRRITLQGLGEPFLNPDIFKMIEFAHKQNFFVSFATSASFYNQEIEAGLRKYPPNLLAFSVDSMEKASLEAVRVNLNFEKFVSNLEAMVTAVRKSGKNTDIQFHSCVMKINSPYFTKVIELAEKLKVKSVDFSELNLSYLGSVRNKLILTLEDYTNVKKAMNLAAEKGIQSAFTRVYGIKAPGEVLCWYLWRQPYITWGGYVNICCGRPFSSVHNVGNIFAVNSFMEIWNSPKMQALREAIALENVPPVCSMCPMAE
ncbi:MAG: radical SAM protein [Candidatus Omnitrophota bacterium]|nr:radical SAM protein [Candidatus Omnitrophota bacterium]